MGKGHSSYLELVSLEMDRQGSQAQRKPDLLKLTSQLVPQPAKKAHVLAPSPELFGK